MTEHEFIFLWSSRKTIWKAKRNFQRHYVFTQGAGVFVGVYQVFNFVWDFKDPRDRSFKKSKRKLPERRLLFMHWGKYVDEEQQPL